ncbi:transketolase, partial [Candidatus Nomurabacteria bacterium]|nr:transketolase [Candidatus Nomurabacteria bacterium]
MPIKLPKQLGSHLNRDQIAFLKTFAKSCRYSIISMLKNAKSGHPGGSLSCIDYLTLLYAFRIAHSGEPIVVSNGHISPAVYAVLAELGYIKKNDAIAGFRKANSPFEGHVTRHVPGVFYGTGPLAVGVSAASGFALAEKIKDSDKYVYALIGDGESQEGQVYEMMHFASKYKLNNFIVFMDYNQVQLSNSLKSIMPIDPKKTFTAAGWQVIEVDGHDFHDMWKGLAKAHESNVPVLLLGNTIMGKGVSFMEHAGLAREATWHGNAPNIEQSNQALKELVLKIPEKKLL